MRAGRLGRLTKRPQFQAAAKGRRFRTERMMVQARLREDEAVPGPALRVGFTVTKREGSATERNRIRRRLRAAVARSAAPHAAAAADLVVVGRRDALQAPFAALVEDLARALPILLKPRGPHPHPR